MTNLDFHNGNANAEHFKQLRLFLEEVCCDLCRFHHLGNESRHSEVKILREFYLGTSGAFADLRIESPGESPYFLEVKYGCPNDVLLKNLERKYGHDCQALCDASKVIVVIDVVDRCDWGSTEKRLRQIVDPRLTLEIWSESTLTELVSKTFGITFDTMTEDNVVKMREAINQAKAAYAFGDMPPDAPLHPLQASLIWHFGSWHLRQMRTGTSLDPRNVLPPGLYSNIVVLLADMCSFSSYVRDTPDQAVVRQCLTSFYSKARYQIINNGGMMYQFVGDEVVALYGLTGNRPNYVQDAFETAAALIDIGNSVSHQWQRHIDRVQQSGGVHIGMAQGELQIVSLQPFGRTHMGAVGDVINMAARLMANASQGEVVISNKLHAQANETAQSSFEEMEPVEARNIGRIKAWKSKRLKLK